MDPHKDFKADEIHNNTRAMITTGNKIRREAPTIRNSPTGPARRGGPSPMMNAIGGTSIHYHATMTTKGNPNGPNLSTHTYGGTRMGNNPETSVVDKWGFSHEAPNLGMLGGSVFGTSGARNPTLTIQALAWRTAEHLAKNWKSIAG